MTYSENKLWYLFKRSTILTHIIIPDLYFKLWIKNQTIKLKCSQSRIISQFLVFSFSEIRNSFVSPNSTRGPRFWVIIEQQELRRMSGQKLGIYNPTWETVSVCLSTKPFPSKIVNCNIFKVKLYIFSTLANSTCLNLTTSISNFDVRILLIQIYFRDSNTIQFCIFWSARSTPVLGRTQMSSVIEQDPVLHSRSTDSSSVLTVLCLAWVAAQSTFSREICLKYKWSVNSFKYLGCLLSR